MTKTVVIHHDWNADNPLEWDAWRMVSFNSKDTNFGNGEELTEQLVFASGRFFWLSHYEHGQRMWFLKGDPAPPGVEFQWDGVKMAGYLVWEDEDNIPEDLEAKARDILKTYTAYIRGEVFSYEHDGDWIGNLYGTEAVEEDIKHVFGEDTEMEYA